MRARAADCRTQGPSLSGRHEADSPLRLPVEDALSAATSPDGTKPINPFWQVQRSGKVADLGHGEGNGDDLILTGVVLLHRHPVVETIADHVLLQGGVAFIDQRHHGRVEIVLDREHAAMIAAAMSQEKPPEYSVCGEVTGALFLIWIVSQTIEIPPWPQRLVVFSLVWSFCFLLFCLYGPP